MSQSSSISPRLELPPSLPPAVLWGGGFWVLVIGLVMGKQLFKPKASSAPAQLPDLDQLNFQQAMQWLGFGKQLEGAKQYEAAVSVYDKGLAQYPDDYRLWHEKGLALARLERFAEALACYNSALKLKPDDPGLLHERADTLLELEQYDQAIAGFDRCLRYSPGLGHFLIDRGYALLHLKRPQAAQENLRQALQSPQLSPQEIRRARYYYIEALKLNGQLAEALTQSQAALSKHPEDYFQSQHEALIEAIAQKEPS